MLFMKFIYAIFCCIIFITSLHAQEVSVKELNIKMNTLAKELGLSSEQKFQVLEIDKSYLDDMNGIKDRAETGYNPPKHIQHQHAYTLLRHIIALEKVLSAEQFKKIQEMRYDIYLYKDWLTAFYKKNKLPTVEQAVEKRMRQSKSNAQ